MGYVAKLKKGVKTLDLSSGIYSLGRDFIPPRSSIAPLAAVGTSANRYGGSERIGERASNTGLTFSVRILGGSNAEVERGVRDIATFLRGAGDEYEPLFFEWRPDNNVSAEPMWGQFGANLRVEVVGGTVDRWGGYGSGNIRNKAVFAIIALEIKPLVLGKRQRLAAAAGGIIDNNWGNPSGLSRGLNFAPARTNYVTNPIFAHATYDNDWADSASMSHSKNTDPEYVLFGNTSVKCQTTADDQYFYQTLAVTNTVTYSCSCYIKMRDSSTPTTAQIKIRMLGGGTPTFRQIGDGWWMAYNNYTATADENIGVGLQIMSDVTVYLGGMQFEARSLPTPLICGDWLGCSWSGTLHDSNSVRADPILYLPVEDSINNGAMTIRVAWKPEIGNTWTTSAIFFDTTTDNEITGYVNTGTVSFRIGSTTISSAAPMSWSVGDLIIMHFVAQPGSLKIYWNGAQAATGTAFDIPFPSTNLIIGNDAGGSYPADGTIMGFATFDRAMTAAEVLADYTNAYEVVSGGDGLGQMLEPIPYIWTKDGDSVVDNCNDTTYDNYAVAGGIPGDVEADTVYYLTTSADFTTIGELLLCRLDEDYKDFFRPDNGIMFYDVGSTSDTACCGELKLNTSCGTASVTLASATANINDRATKYLLDRNIYMAARVADGSARSVNLTWRIQYNDSTVITSDTLGVSTTTTFKLFLLPSLRMLPAPSFSISKLTSSNLAPNYYYLAGIDPDATDTISVDYFALLPEPVINLDFPTTGATNLVMNGTNAWTAVATTFVPSIYIPTLGEAVNLLPNRYNVLQSFIGSDTINPVITYTLTYTKVYVIPRWSIS